MCCMLSWVVSVNGVGGCAILPIIEVTRLQYWNMASLQYYITVTNALLKWQYCNISILQYYNTAILQYCNITILQYFITASYWRTIPCQRSEKKVNFKKWIFFWWNVKDNKAIWWFWNLRGVFCLKSKIPKNYCLEKVKIEGFFSFFLFKDPTTNYTDHIYHLYSMNFMILLICFVVCNV